MDFPLDVRHIKTKIQIGKLRYDSLAGISLHYHTLHTTPAHLYSTPTAIMPMCCINCRAVASLDHRLQYCAGCQSALYCSRACQKEDWQKHHKQICKLLNVGHGDMQVRTVTHTNQSDMLKKTIEAGQRFLDEDGKRFFKLFEESTFEGSQAAARKMKKIAKRQTKNKQKFLLFHSLHLLACSDSAMLTWPNSPLLVMLQFVDPNVLIGPKVLIGRDEDEALQEGQKIVTPLHLLTELAHPIDYSTHENQLILAKQLIKHGANVNALTRPKGVTPLHNACCGCVVTNLEFVELLLKKGADPNAQGHRGVTPLMYTTMFAPGAAKFLLNWSTTDANITTRSGASFLARVRDDVKYFSDSIAYPDNPERIQHQFLLRQWREIEEMLVERGAVDTGITALE
jgi:hypothetical protein